MQITRMLLGGMAVLLLLAAPLAAQEKPIALETPTSPLKVQIVFTETQGERKVSSLPYALHLMGQDVTSSSVRQVSQGKLRMGLRVPIQAGKEGQLQYMDVGTNIDCWAQRMSDGRYRLSLNLQRSTTYAPELKSPGSLPTVGETPVAGSNPILGQFSAELNLLLQDGQTIQSIVATDPVSGRTLKVDVTLSVVK